MSISLIIPIGADNIEYENYMPYIFNFAPDGISLCIKSVSYTHLDVYKRQFLHFFSFYLKHRAKNYPNMK